MPEITVPTLEMIPEVLQEFAIQTDEGFKIDVIHRLAFENLRELNETLESDKSELAIWKEEASAIVGEDIKQFQVRIAELERIAQMVKDGELKGSDVITREVDVRVANMKAEYESLMRSALSEVESWKAKAESVRHQLNRTIVEAAVADAVHTGGSGALPSALEDIQRRAHAIFSVNERGAIVAKDGEATIYGRNGIDAMTPREWLDELKRISPFYFEGNNETAEKSGEELYGGLSAADFAKLSGAQQLRIARSCLRS